MTIYTGGKPVSGTPSRLNAKSFSRCMLRFWCSPGSLAMESGAQVGPAQQREPTLEQTLMESSCDGSMTCACSPCKAERAEAVLRGIRPRRSWPVKAAA